MTTGHDYEHLHTSRFCFCMFYARCTLKLFEEFGILGISTQTGDYPYYSRFQEKTKEAKWEYDKVSKLAALFFVPNLYGLEIRKRNGKRLDFSLNSLDIEGSYRMNTLDNLFYFVKFCYESNDVFQADDLLKNIPSVGFSIEDNGISISLVD
ncbi:hypothetical protein QVD17_39130 [Tagetes erecta]|uniref:Uncharacterized protein n=1 Tax=Tagetes erecta TaxID=13708 RepID=A0AAD8JN09_TARER|nr:hypothetical protein QVD17_39130 [Tagetes erecta]